MIASNYQGTSCSAWTADQEPEPVIYVEPSSPPDPKEECEELNEERQAWPRAKSAPTPSRPVVPAGGVQRFGVG